MEVLQSNTADNIYFWIEDRDQGNVNPIYESHGAYEIYIVCNGERRMYLGCLLYTSFNRIKYILCPRH